MNIKSVKADIKKLTTAMQIVQSTENRLLFDRMAVLTQISNERDNLIQKLQACEAQAMAIEGKIY